MSRKLAFSIALLSALLLLPLPAAGANITWTGAPATPADWFDPTNWDLDRIPNSADYAYIDNGGTASIASPGATIGTLDLESTVTMTAGTLQAGNIYLANAGSGTFVQTGGSVAVSNLLALGAHVQGAYGPANYNLQAGDLTAGSESIGSIYNSTFTQTGGTNTVTNTLTLGGNYYAAVEYDLSGTGILNVHDLTLDGTSLPSTTLFNQSGGVATVIGTLTLGGQNSHSLEYELQAGQLSDANTVVGAYTATPTFVQTGGTHVVSQQLETTTGGSYNLQAGSLTTGSTLDDYSFLQSGGVHHAGILTVTSNGTYSYSAGTLDVDYGLVVAGTLNCGSAPLALNLANGGVVDLGQGTILNSQNASLTLAGNCLLIEKAGFNPTAVFGGGFSNQGLTYNVGSKLVVPAGREVDAWTTLQIQDHVVCDGIIQMMNGASANFANGLEMWNNGSASLGSGTMTVNDSVSGIGGGASLTVANINVGYSGTGSFQQTGGTANVTNTLALGNNPGGSGSGTYQLSGDNSLLTCAACNVGPSGTGNFVQSGGTNIVTGTLKIGAKGSYDMEGGSLSAGTLTIISTKGSYQMAGGSLTVGTLNVDGASSTGCFNVTSPSCNITVSNALNLYRDSSVNFVSGTVIHMQGSAFNNNNYSFYAASMASLTNLTLVYDAQTGANQTFEVAGKDDGRSLSGLVDNFALGGIELENKAVLQLVDNYNNFNQGGVGGNSEALYLDSLTMLPGSTLNLDGLHLYVENLNYQGGTITGGTLISLCPGDSDGNFCVDGADLATWQQNYDPTGAHSATNSFTMGDWNGDGVIDGADLALWQQNYNPTGAPAQSTPEPGTLILLGTGVLALAGTARRKLM